MYGPALKRAEPGRRVIDREGLDRFHEAAITLPVVAVALGDRPDARLEGLESERPRSDTIGERRPVGPDAQSLLRQQGGQVGVAAVERDGQSILASRLDVGEAGEQRLRA